MRVEEPRSHGAAEARDTDGGLSVRLARMRYGHAFRRYQSLALEAFELAHRSGRERVYLVMPPGSGKTAVGLEIARRLGRRTLALGPNSAIQAQWVSQWRDFEPALVAASTDVSLSAPVTALTYQMVCSLDAESEVLDEKVRELLVHETSPLAPDTGELRRRARLLTAQAGRRDELLNLLHPNGRALVERIGREGEWTILLDECHHLLQMWGYLLLALLELLGKGAFVVGLTATPPVEMTTRELALHRELFGRADFEVPTPAVVKEGELAPYQELVYLTTPLTQEADYIESQRLRFQELISALMDPELATMPLLDWVRRRAVEPRTAEGAQVPWRTIEVDAPELCRALLRLCCHLDLPLPADAQLREGDRRPPTADDWVLVIEDYCVHQLGHNARPRDRAAWDLIRRSLPDLGYALGSRGVRTYVSPVDRVLQLSGSKALAAAEILRGEADGLGDRLRALVICDYELASGQPLRRLRGVMDAQAGSAALMLETLVRDPATAPLDPVLVTGQTVACSLATAGLLCAHLGIGVEEIRPPGGTERHWEQVVEVRPATGAWEPRDYLPAVTSFFEKGGSRCLVGTRGLLGEGWDARSVNVLIDATGVTTTTSVHQIRGRSLRLDPDFPEKVANNWSVVCVASGHPKGLADYDRFVRKHRHYYALTPGGEVESGVSHVDPRFSPFGPPPSDQFAAVNGELLERAGQREAARSLWRIGEPYRNAPVHTVRVRAARPIGVPKSPLRSRPNAPAPPRLQGEAALILLFGITALVVAPVAGQQHAFVGVAIGSAAGLGLAWRLKRAGQRLRDYLRAVSPSAALADLGAAVAQGLAGAGLIALKTSDATVRVVPQPDGYYRCYLEGASLADSRIFAEALEELLLPLSSPRYMVPRYVADQPRSAFEALALLALRALRPKLGSRVVYHAVPTVLAANRRRVDVFVEAWHRHVSAGEPLFERDPRAQAVLQVQRGEDPFAVTTQIRTLWQ